MGISKRIIGIVAVIAIVVVAIIAAVLLNDGSAPVGNDGGETEGTDGRNETGGNDVRPQLPEGTMVGNGTGATERFELFAGVAVFNLTHEGEGTFSMTLYSDDQTYVNPLVNEAGAYNGSRLVGINATDLVAAKPGPHYVQVEGEGAWTVLVVQPNVTAAQGAPVVLTGAGDSSGTPFELAGETAVFTMTYGVESNFSAILWTASGGYGDLLANEAVGTQSEKEVTIGTDLFQVPPGVCWLDIRANGPWTVTIAARGA